MKLVRLTLCNFQSFGPTPKTVDLTNVTFVLGPNGAGKTALMVGLCRMFGADRSRRRIRKSDFHCDGDGNTAESLWLQADFEVPEAADKGVNHPTVPAFFDHMQLESATATPTLRIRLSANLVDDEAEERIQHVVTAGADGEPVAVEDMAPADRNQIQVHYLPARRDPAEQLSYAATTLLGRALRAADFRVAAETIQGLVAQMNDELVGHQAIDTAQVAISASWESLYSGGYLSDATVGFGATEIEAILRLITVTFTPAPGGDVVALSRLSDGQKSLMYIALVLALHTVGRQVLHGESDAFDPVKMRPAIFSLIALEEPENSLSPHYLGRITAALRALTSGHDAQALLATHSPAMMRRVDPDDVRYLRLDESRCTDVRTVRLPDNDGEAHKFVREAVQAFPEVYFARMVVLGEGDTEEIILPRMLSAHGIVGDDASIAIAPLGGRHVNHFWRLLHGLGIPHVTLLDLDMRRFGGGWGRIRYAANELRRYDGDALQGRDIDEIPKWDDLTTIGQATDEGSWLKSLEEHNVFYSGPLDLDLLMLYCYPAAYGVVPGECEQPDATTIAAVLGKDRVSDGYPATWLRLFEDYLRLFKRSSKPVSHIAALSELMDNDLRAAMPKTLGRLVQRVGEVLVSVPA
jgi:putative ATP-dependent endonuclease of OLD family